MEIVFLDRNNKILELDEFFYKYPTDDWGNEFVIRSRWYRDNVIFKLGIDKENIFIAKDYKIINADPNNITIKEDNIYTQDEFNLIFGTNIKLTTNRVEIILCEQEKITIPIEEYIQSIKHINSDPIEISLSKYDNQTVIDYIKMMKDLNIKEYSFTDYFGIKYDIINCDTYFTVSELSDYHRLNFKLR